MLKVSSDRHYINIREVSMSINFKQSQFELFPGTQGTQVEVDRPRFFFAHLTLSIENLVVVSIVILMFIVLSFSLGVESGKKVMVTRYREYQARISQNPPTPTTTKTPVPQTQGTNPKKVSQPANAAVIPVPARPVNPSLMVRVDATPVEKKALQPVSSLVYFSPDSSPRPYTIQVASFKKQEYANQEALLLKQKGYEIFVLSKGEHSIVCVGRFLLQKQAESFSARLKKQYKDCLVRRF